MTYQMFLSIAEPAIRFLFTIFWHVVKFLYVTCQKIKMTVNQDRPNRADCSNHITDAYQFDECHF